jgi:hypothetical protein
MRKYSKFIVVGGTLLALAVPSAAMADAPNGTLVGNGQTGTDYVIHANANASREGQLASEIKQNGQFVRVQAQAGERSALVAPLVP